MAMLWEHGGSIAPQRPAFPIRSLGLMVIKIPLFGTGPSSLFSPIFSGIGPLRLLHIRFNSCRFLSSAISFGISPESWLSEISRYTKDVIFPISGGILPPKFWPNSPGIGPLNVPTAKSRYSRLVRLPNSRGIGPSN
ncbi:hypothetical protein CDL12_16952 [Handroanthus impetiginosus]|uniref:Uncharacterized protein n=1 Tax=Handroanthus impetiginosus TaxID=429701 RepID=A0A2G9GYU4_9LAMI|nr:hypothetical protein CDL12_16952 [Handroanthus impetiginosus]